MPQFLKKDGRGTPGPASPAPLLPPALEKGKDDLFFQEQLRALRAKVEYQVDTRKYRTLAVTSAIAGEGKTILTSKLALNLAATGRKKVLLIDTDLRKGDVARVFGLEEVPGLSDYLRLKAKPEQIVRNSIAAGLSIIPGGKTLESPSEMLAGDRFRAFLRDVGQQYDVVLLDTPPVLAVADTICLKDMVDGVILVFRASFTPYAMVQQAAEELGTGKVVGVVINGVAPNSQKYYKRYYGKYYSKSTKA